MTAKCPFATLFGSKKNPHASGLPEATPTPLEPLSTLLRSSTQLLHDQAESHPLQADLVRGVAPVEHYAAILQQLAHVHAALEPLLRTLQSHAKLATLIQPHHFHLHALENDLRFMGAGRATALGATARFVDLIHRAGPTPALLGVFYVLEGSTNGGTVIARAVRSAYGWESEAGTSFINPHGTLVRQRWGSFKTQLDTTDFTTEERHTILAIASATFTAYHAMLDDIHTSLTATA